MTHAPEWIDLVPDDATVDNVNLYAKLEMRKRKLVAGDLDLGVCKRVKVSAKRMREDDPAQVRCIELTGEANKLAHIQFTDPNKALYTQQACRLDPATARFNIHPAAFERAAIIA